MQVAPGERPGVGAVSRAIFRGQRRHADTNARFAESLDLDYPILSDPGGDRARLRRARRRAASRRAGRFTSAPTAAFSTSTGTSALSSHGHDVAAKLASWEFRRGRRLDSYVLITSWPRASAARLERVMALLDRFRTQARHKHPDAAIRLAYIDEIPIDERDLIAEIARDDEDARVRRAAVAKLLDPAALAAVARADVDDGGPRAGGRHAARHRARVVRRARRSRERSRPSARSTTPRRSRTSRRTRRAKRSRSRALARVTDVHAAGSIARHAALEAVRRAAFVRLRITPRSSASP